MKRRLYIIIYFVVFWVIIPGVIFLISAILDRLIFPGIKLTDRWTIPGFILSIPCFLILLLTLYQFRLFSGEYPVSATPPDKIIQRGIFAVWRHPVYLFAQVPSPIERVASHHIAAKTDQVKQLFWMFYISTVR